MYTEIILTHKQKWNYILRHIQYARKGKIRIAEGSSHSLELSFVIKIKLHQHYTVQFFITL
jgi:hypothetical protein